MPKLYVGIKLKWFQEAMHTCAKECTNALLRIHSWIKGQVAAGGPGRNYTFFAVSEQVWLVTNRARSRGTQRWLSNLEQQFQETHNHRHSARVPEQSEPGTKSEWYCVTNDTDHVNCETITSHGRASLSASALYNSSARRFTAACTVFLTAMCETQKTL